MISLSRPLKFLYATMLMLAGACLKTTLLSAQTTFKEKELHQYHLDTWGEREGLSTSAIIDIAQDQEGYLWISTHRGLLRFDGYRFVLFNKFSEESFQTSGMRVFLRDKKGNFFVSSNGSGIYIYQKGKFVPYTEKKGLGDPHVYDIFEDSRGRFWAGTKEGVYVLEPEETVFKPVFVETEVRKIIAQVIREDAHGKIWFGTEEGLFFLNQKGLIERFLKQDRQNILAVTTMLLDQQRTFWIGSYSEGLYQWLPHEPFPKKYPLTLSVKHVNQLYQNDYGVYFIASDEGLYRFFDNQLSQITTRNGLIHNNVNAIYQDKEGSLWFGSYYGGFHRLKNARFHTLSITEKLPNNTIHALYEENDSTVWVCTGEGLACLVHEKVVENSLLKKLKSALPNLKLRDMLKDTQGNYWIASYDGLLRYDSRKNKVSIIGINNGLKNAQIRVLLEDKNHQLWVGTRGGLHRLDLNGTVLNAFTLSDGLQSDLITDLLEDEKGIIWISTTSGIHIWNPSSEKIVPLFTKDGREKNTNFRMYLDAEGLLWVGSIYGLWVLKEGKIYYFSQANPLLSNTVFQVLEDEERNFWLTTEIGILKVERRALLDYLENPKKLPRVYHYDKSDGLNKNECTATARSIRTRQGKLYIASTGGVAVLSSKYLRNEVLPPVVIEQITIDAMLIDPYLPEIVVTPKIQHIEIQYTALSFLSPQKIKFKYRLFGYDEDWIEADNRRIAYYTNLMPGEYVFKVIACNSDDRWNFDGDQLLITIYPPFWKKTWFLMLAALAFLGLVYAAYRYRINLIKREKRILEQKVKLRTQEIIMQKEEIEAQRDYIEEKNKELDNAIKELEKANAIIKEQYQALETINSGLEWLVKERTKELSEAHRELDEFVYKASHDLKGPLARIDGLCQLALHEKNQDSAITYFQLLRKESQITNDTLNKLIKARNVKNSVLKYRICRLNEIVREAWQKIEETKAAQNVIFVAEIEPSTQIVTDLFMLKTAIFLVLENAVCYKSELRPQVYFRYTWNGKSNMHLIEIEDNGIGIEPEAQDRIFEMFFKGTRLSEGAGLGLYIAKMAMERIQGKIRLKESRKGRTIFELTLQDFSPENLESL